MQNLIMTLHSGNKTLKFVYFKYKRISLISRKLTYIVKPKSQINCFILTVKKLY